MATQYKTINNDDAIINNDYNEVDINQPQNDIINPDLVKPGKNWSLFLIIIVLWLIISTSFCFID